MTNNNTESLALNSLDLTEADKLSSPTLLPKSPRSDPSDNAQSPLPPSPNLMDKSLQLNPQSSETSTFEDVISTNTSSLETEDKIQKLKDLVDFGNLSIQEKYFISVFLDGKYVKNNHFPPISVSTKFLREICQNKSHLIHFENYISSSMTLIKSSIPSGKRFKVLSNPFTSSDIDIETNITWNLQETSCQVLPKDIPRCCHCIKKHVDSCRFKGIRTLAYNSDDKLILTAPQWQTYSDDLIEYPLMVQQRVVRPNRAKEQKELLKELATYKTINKKFAPIKLERRHKLLNAEKIDYVKYILKNCSTPLRSFLTLQLDFFNHSPLYLKKMSSSGRHQCDNCRSTLLNIYYLSKHCGLEICHNCYLDANISNIFTDCVRQYKHTMTDFIPVTVYPKSIFEWLLENCENLTRDVALTSSTVPEELFVYNGQDKDEDESQRLYKPYPRGKEQDIKLESYQSLMQQGIPFVVQGISPHHYEQFNADTLQEFYGGIKIEQLDNDSTKPTQVLLSQFFDDFTTYDDTKPSIKYRKIKDWPPFSEFQTCFPKLYQTFLNSLPFKECTQPDGFLNLARYLPPNLNPPDLGPKMYIATGTENIEFGTTPLHLDAADAVNIMTHSYRSGYEFANVQCAALWHIFEYKDMDKIRDYLSDWHLKQPKQPKQPKQNIIHDYIHDQRFYLTQEMLKELKEKAGVTAFQIYQNPGDGVFIPAGCAHQVMNLSNCIKIATDFISSERTIQCMRVAHDFSKLPRAHPRNDDIIQTQNHILFSSSNIISQLQGKKDKLLSCILEKGGLSSSKKTASKRKSSTKKPPKKKKA